jgi:hypothetical protein
MYPLVVGFDCSLIVFLMGAQPPQKHIYEPQQASKEGTADPSNK